MASKRHDSVKKMLNSAVAPLKEADKTPRLHHMRHLLEMGTFFYLLPWGVHYKRVKIGKDSETEVNVEVIIPNKSNRDKVLLYFHGGGYTIGSMHTHRSLVGKIAKKTKIISVLVDYRKAPENKFPAAIEDAIASYKSLLKRGKKPENIIIGGDSAGGGLTIATLVALKDLNLPQPKAAFCLSPWVDLAATGESIKTNTDDPLVDERKMNKWIKMYVGSHDVKNPLISPLYADLSGIAPLLIQTSNAEMLYSDATRIADRAKKFGVEVELQEWDGLMHWWHLFQRVIPEADEAIEKIVDFINAKLNGKQETL